MTGGQWAPARIAGLRWFWDKEPRERHVWLFVSLLAVSILAWISIVIGVPQANFTIGGRADAAACEAASDLARLFAALVLVLSLRQRNRERLLWVAAGLLILSTGGILFGLLPIFLGRETSLQTAIFEAFLVWTVGGMLFAVGLAPRRPPACTRLWVGVAMASFLLVAAAIILIPNSIGILTSLQRLPANSSLRVLDSMTPVYFLLSAMPLWLWTVAAIGAGRGYHSERLPAWLPIAIVWQLGAQLTNLIWPSAFTSSLSGSELFRLAFATAVCTGGVLELRWIASERTTMLRDEQERTRRLAELSMMKADFSAMVAHELHSPLASIRAYTAMLATDELS
jgi:signal transduction histidine kinase